MLTADAFERWLTAYGHAWETRDPEAAVRIFAADALYYWTPFGPPKKGHSEIAAAWGQATSGQRNIHFGFTIWSVSELRGVAHWHTRLTRAATGLAVELDGVLLADFDPAGACRVFREWWHAAPG